MIARRGSFDTSTSFLHGNNASAIECPFLHCQRSGMNAIEGMLPDC
jgi:hypothetical protein